MFLFPNTDNFNLSLLIYGGFLNLRDGEQYHFFNQWGTLGATCKYATYNWKRKKKSPTRYKLTPIRILNYNLLASLNPKRYDFPISFSTRRRAVQLLSDGHRGCVTARLTHHVVFQVIYTSGELNPTSHRLPVMLITWISPPPHKPSRSQHWVAGLGTNAAWIWDSLKSSDSSETNNFRKTLKTKKKFNC